MKRTESSLSRRQVVELGSLAAAAAALPGVGRTRPDAAPLALPPDQQHFALAETTVAELQDGMQSGKLTSRSITQTYLDRIRATNLESPTLRAVLETNPDALDIADRLDAERKQGTVRGPLHGIPVIVKDNIDTHDKLLTCAGSLALLGNYALKDAGLVERLRAAGAVIPAKANLSEWANFRSTRSSSGWSGRGRQCRNPYVLDRNPSGSSSGSAASASANLCAGAVGTETDGSITSPSNACGIVGLKPTVGLVSRAGVIPISHSQDTAGPMCRTVADVAALLAGMTGVDPRDEATAAAQGHIEADYTKFLDPNGLTGMRIGVRPRNGRIPGADALVGQGLGELRPGQGGRGVGAPRSRWRGRGKRTRSRPPSAAPSRAAVNEGGPNLGDGDQRYREANHRRRQGFPVRPLAGGTRVAPCGAPFRPAATSTRSAASTRWWWRRASGTASRWRRCTWAGAPHRCYRRHP